MCHILPSRSTYESHYVSHTRGHKTNQFPVVAVNRSDRALPVFMDIYPRNKHQHKDFILHSLSEWLHCTPQNVIHNGLPCVSTYASIHLFFNNCLLISYGTVYKNKTQSSFKNIIIAYNLVHAPWRLLMGILSCNLFEDRTCHLLVADLQMSCSNLT